MAQTQIRGSTQILANSITASQMAAGIITSAKISATAGILGSQLSSSAAIIGTQLSSSAAIAGTQLSSSAAIIGTQLSSSANILGTQLSSTAAIANGQLATSYIQASGATTYIGSQSAGGFTITNLAVASASTDISSKAYVDAVATGSVVRFARVVQTTNFTLGASYNIPVIDGVTTSVNDIVLLTGQTTASQNGFWQVTAIANATAPFTRPTNYAAGAVIVEGLYTIIDADGTTYKNTKWFNTNVTSITVDTTATTWVQDQSGISYVAGNGLVLTGSSFAATLGNGTSFDGSNKIQAVAKDTSLTVASTGINISPGTAGQLMLTNSGATAAAFATLSGDVTLSTAGVASVSNTAGTGFLKYANIITLEVVAGTINSTNTTFTIANTPQGNINLFWNGVFMNVGAGNDYTISGLTITTLFTPSTGDVLLASYSK